MENYTNASYCPEITNMLKQILEDIAKEIIKEGNPFIILEEYRWMPEVLSLWAKQVNLCDSCILLLENGMEQEAYVLARSQFNNMLWIKYICDGDEPAERAKEYFFQTTASEIIHNKQLITLLKDFDDYHDERLDKTEYIKKLEQSIEEHEKILTQNEISKKLKSIAELSKQDTVVFGAYLTMYNNASQLEHSDMRAVRKYRKAVLDDYTKEQVFTLDLTTSDKKQWLIVLHYSLMSLFYSFDSFTTRIKNKDSHLLEHIANQSSFSQDAFDNILMGIKMCMAMLEKEMESVE